MIVSYRRLRLDVFAKTSLSKTTFFQNPLALKGLGAKLATLYMINDHMDDM